MCTYKPRESTIVGILEVFHDLNINKTKHFCLCLNLRGTKRRKNIEYSYKSCIYKKKIQVSLFSTISDFRDVTKSYIESQMFHFGKYVSFFHVWNL